MDGSASGREGRVAVQPSCLPEMDLNQVMLEGATMSRLASREGAIMSRSAFLGLLVATAVSACGGEPVETTPTFLYPTQASFCEALATMECNTAVVKACYGSDDTTVSSDQASCVA